MIYLLVEYDFDLRPNYVSKLKHHTTNIDVCRFWASRYYDVDNDIMAFDHWWIEHDN